MSKKYNRRFRHGFHAAISIATMGLWLPIYGVLFALHCKSHRSQSDSTGTV